MVIFNITLVRHGETSHNKECVIQGQLDVPLSPLGEKQCELLGKHLQGQKFTHIYASDLRRAKQTAEIIAKHNLHFKGNIIEDKRLRERKFGEVEGKPVSFLKEAAQKAKQLLPSYTPKGAETTKQVYERTAIFFKDLCKMLHSIQELKEKVEPETSVLSDPKVETNNNSADFASSTNKRKRECSCDFPNKVECPLTNSPNDITHEKPQLCPESKNASSLAALKLENSSEYWSDSLDEPPSIVANGSIDSQPRPGSVASSNDVRAPQLAANILVVAHGGSLKEMIRYFLEELKCAVPGGREQALRISPNTGLSKFTISLSTEEPTCPIPVIFCHLIHDKQHLASMCNTSSSSPNSSRSSKS